MSDSKVHGRCTKAVPFEVEDRERNAPALTYFSSDGTDIECPEEGVRDEDTAANATQQGAFHVEGIGSNRDEAGLWMNMAASAAVVLTSLAAVFPEPQKGA
jgi:hypothetical protein